MGLTHTMLVYLYPTSVVAMLSLSASKRRDLLPPFFLVVYSREPIVTPALSKARRKRRFARGMSSYPQNFMGIYDLSRTCLCQIWPDKAVTFDWAQTCHVKA